jgi:hypothetical protein
MNENTAVAEGADGMSLDEIDEMDRDLLKDPAEVEKRVVGLMKDIGCDRETALSLITGDDGEE